jgi:nucleotide-binding universal stress UspA family protein
MERRIVAPTDFSDASDRALDLAASWSGPLAAEVCVIHVAGDPLEPWESARQKLEDRTARLTDRGIRCSGKLVQARDESGDVVDIARKPGDCILMATHGRSGLRRAVLGSWAEDVLRRASCPVITLSAEASRPDSLRTIVIGVDGSPASKRAREMAQTLSNALGPAKLLLVHSVAAPPDILPLFEEQGAPLPDPDPREFEPLLEPTLAALRANGLSPEVVAEYTRPAKLILEVASRAQADLIALGTHGRTGLARLVLGSVAEEVVRHATCPVVTTSAPEEERGDG